VRFAMRRHPPARNHCHSAPGLIVSTAIIYFAMPLGIALHENIMVAATVAIGAFVFRPRQLIGYDRLRSQPA
jgi:hypothetical protein